MDGRDERDGEVHSESTTAHHVADVPVGNRSPIVAYLRSGFGGIRCTRRQFTCWSEHFIIAALTYKEYSTEDHHCLSAIELCCTVTSTVHTSSENLRILRQVTLYLIVLSSLSNLSLT